MSIRPAEQRLPPAPTEADRKALRAFWRGVSCGTFFGLGLSGVFSGWLS